MDPQLRISQDEKGHKEDGKSDNQHQRAAARRLPGEHHGRDTENGANRIQDAHALLLPEAHVDQSVMQMSAIRCKRALAVRKPTHDRKEGVGKRQPENGQRDKEREHHIALKHADDREDRQRITEEQCTGIAHENARRIGVERQKAEAGGSDQRRDQAVRHTAVGQQHGETKRDRADGGNAAGKPVQPINEVDRIGQPHDPENRDRNRPVAEGNVLAEKADVVDRHALRDRKERSYNLHRQLKERIEAIDIIQNAEQHQRAAPDQDGNQLPVQPTETD